MKDVNEQMACQQQEIFGPILPLRPFKDLNEVLALANKSDFGLSAYVYTGSIQTALR